MKKLKKFEVTIAVIPFVNASEDSTLDYFVDGFYDDFMMDLSRFRSLQIISQKSAAKVLQNKNLLQAQKSLGADFLIMGKVRKTHDKVKIYIQLIASTNEVIIWAQRFEKNIEQLFEVQDDIIRQVANTIQDQIDTNLLAATRKKQVQNLEAYDYWLKGYDQLKKGQLKNDLKARIFFEKALKKDAHCSRAYTGISLSYFNEWSCQIWDLWDSSMNNALKYAKLAISLDPNDAVALTVIGRMFLYQGDYERGAYYLNKSLQLSPNEANNLAQIAVSYVYLGHPKKALELYEKAKKLNPLREEDYTSGALIHIEVGAYEKAISLGLRADFHNSWVDLTAMIAGAYYMTGDIDQMKKYWDIYLVNFKERVCGNKKIEPQEALDWIIRISPYKKTSTLVPFWEYLAKTNFNQNSFGASKPSEKDAQLNVFCKGTGLWEISYQGNTVFLSDKKGYFDLRKLLVAPGGKFSASELMGSKINVERKVLTIDEKAKKAYKERLLALSQDIDEYDLNNDYENLKKSRQEYETILEHLSRSVNFRGGKQKFQDLSDKARSAVTWRIRDAIKMIQTVHPELGKHLTDSIVTGYQCSYAPNTDIIWVGEKAG